MGKEFITNIVLTGSNVKKIVYADAVVVDANTTKPTQIYNVNGFSKCIAFINASGLADLKVGAVLSDGTLIGAQSFAYPQGVTQAQELFDTNGVESIYVFARDKSGSPNTITVELYFIP